MAETIGLISGIAGIAAAGAKVSLSLYQFASTVESARTDIISVGQEISLLCAVLTQISTAIDNQRLVRFTPDACHTTYEIVERCRSIFEEISEIIDGLRGKQVLENAEDGEGRMRWIQRVKWVFKRTRVQMLRKSLDSMKITLHLMLTTLDFSEKIHSRPWVISLL
jgi:hypothetical protein